MSTQSLTNAGRALLAAKQAAGQVATFDRFMLANITGLDHTQPVNQNEAIPDVADQVKTLAVTKDGYISPDEVVYSLYLPTTEGDYTYNWLGLLADDDTLVAVAYLAPVDKYATAGGVIGNALNENIMVAYTDAQAITNITIDASAWQFDFENATETQKGLAEVATQTETNAGTDDARMITPLKLASRLLSFVRNATTTVKGFVELATNEEVQAGTDTSRVVTPAGLSARTATESRTGIAEVATQSETDAGTDNTRLITPLKLASRLASFTRNATTTVKGFVEIATNAEVQAGTDTSRVVTPAGLSARTATESRAGIAEVATQAETDAGTNDSRIVTPKKLKAAIPPAFDAGTTMLFVQAAAPTGWTKVTTHHNKALRIVNTSGGGSSGSVDFTAAFKSKSVNGSISNTTAGGSVSIANTTLTNSTSPAHEHSLQLATTGDSNSTNSPVAVNSRGTYASIQNPMSSHNKALSSGGGGAHSHTGTFTGWAHGHTFSGTAINLAVKYVDAIICQKDAV